MKPVDQTIMHRPWNGEYGDCMRAMVASVLEFSIESVPHFLHDGTPDGAEFARRVNDFLRPMNLAYIEFPITEDARKAMFATGVRGLVHEASGPGARGVFHACVAIDGEIVHDPHPSKTGLEEIAAYGIFVVLDPSKPIGRSAAA